MPPRSPKGRRPLAGPSPPSRSSPMKTCRLLVLSVPLLGLFQLPPALPQEKPKPPAKPPSPDKLIGEAVKLLLSLQDKSGAWSYEGVYRVKRDLPVGYRVGGTAAVGSTLLVAAP